MIDEFVVFNQLKKEQITQILEIQIKELNQRLSLKFNLNLMKKKNLLNVVLMHFGWIDR